MPLITSPVLSHQEQKTANFNSILSDVEQNSLREPAKRCLYQGAIELAADELSILCEASEWLIPYRHTDELKKEAIRLLELVTNPNPDGEFEED